MPVCCQCNICNDMKFFVIFHIKFDFFTPLFGELSLTCFEKKFFQTDWKRLLYCWIDMSYKSQPKQTKKDKYQREHEEYFDKTKLSSDAVQPKNKTSEMNYQFCNVLHFLGGHPKNVLFNIAVLDRCLCTGTCTYQGIRYISFPKHFAKGLNE